LRIARAVFLAITAIFLHGTAFHAWSISPTEFSSAEELKMSTKKRMLAAAVGGVVLSGASSAHAQDAVQWRVEDGGNGHWYQTIATIGQTWEEARARGASMGGHLVTLATAQEDAFVRSLTPDVTDTGFWIGAFRTPNVVCTGSSWQWVDASPWTYTAWASNQPDCWATGQDRLVVVRGNYFPGWHDFGSFATDIAMAIVEYSADCNSDGIVDYGQIRAGELVDTNANNIPDCCEQGFDCRFNAVQWRVEDGGNGHWYRAVVPMVPPTWDAARADAAASGGSLVSLNTAEETLWCYQLSVANPSAWRVVSGTSALGPWTGGAQQPRSAEPNGGWFWIDGGSVDLVVARADNNNSSGCGVNEDRLIFWHPTQAQPTSSSMGFQTSDFPSRGYCEPTIGPVQSYLLEYSADCNSDGIVDYGQIRAGELVDTNANNIPDCCEQAISCVPCAADIDESGAVNSVDLAAVLSNWGSDGGKYPRADIDGDGTVSSTDLAAVLSAWGPCE
jgi:hypothetical protein